MRLVFVHAVSRDWPLRQLNVNNAFLQGRLYEVQEERGTSRFSCTPILKYLRFPILPAVPEHKMRFLDRDHLQLSLILVGDLRILLFVDRQRTYRYLQLPAPEFTHIISRAQVEFLPPAAALCSRPETGRAARRSACTSTSTTQADYSARASTSSQTPLLDFDESEFIAPVLSEGYTEEEYTRVMYESTQKDNKMKRLLLGVFRKIRSCCVSAPRVDEDLPMVNTDDDERGSATHSADTESLETSCDEEIDYSGHRHHDPSHVVSANTTPSDSLDDSIAQTTGRHHRGRGGAGQQIDSDD